MPVGNFVEDFTKYFSELNDNSEIKDQFGSQLG